MTSRFELGTDMGTFTVRPHFSLFGSFPCTSFRVLYRRRKGRVREDDKTLMALPHTVMAYHETPNTILRHDHLDLYGDKFDWDAPR
jgi:hypothetical protein